MDGSGLLTINERTPLLLRRIERMPDVSPITTTSAERQDPVASHMTVVTTAGNKPEMHDQQEDRSR